MPETVKIIKVTDCEKCPYRLWILNSLVACKENKYVHIEAPFDIPDWCPLEDYKDVQEPIKAAANKCRICGDEMKDECPNCYRQLP